MVLPPASGFFSRHCSASTAARPATEGNFAYGLAASHDERQADWSSRSFVLTKHKLPTLAYLRDSGLPVQRE